jgi:ubiquinol-cytochrome c reductase cytochrome b subunit
MKSTSLSWRWNTLPSIRILDNHIIDYPTPSGLNYGWSFGSLAGICLAIQLFTGIFLAMHYTPLVQYAFYSVNRIITSVEYGWVLRYLHANGASIFFILVYSHLFRGFYHGSYTYPRQELWISGIVIFILMMATAFLGYVLPWGQISFWGATVITSLFSAVPFFGEEIVFWLWGGYSVDNPTLNRFFSLHYLLPFSITGIVFVHLALLHINGSSSPLGLKMTNMNFYPYFYGKDLLGFFVLFFLLTLLVTYIPNTLGDPNNYVPGDCLKTPAHIEPEWYFLPFYAILRAVPHKLGGVLAIGGALVVLVLLPFINPGKTRSGRFRVFYAASFWIWLASLLFLTWVGQIADGDPYKLQGQVVTVIYFAALLIPGIFTWIQKFVKL